VTGKPDIEWRASVLEVRAGGRKLEGYAAVFEQRTTVADFTESIARGAFAETLRSGRDVLALVDHDPGRLLGRTKSGTLRLAEDQRGLTFSIDVPDTQLGRDMLAMAERGDLGGASFGFRVAKGGDSWEGRNRTLLRVELFDVGPVVAFSAYPQTTVTARSREEGHLSLKLAKRFLEAL
jgi:HK97 family phage prohead protease